MKKGLILFSALFFVVCAFFAVWGLRSRTNISLLSLKDYPGLFKEARNQNPQALIKVYLIAKYGDRDGSAEGQEGATELIKDMLYAHPVFWVKTMSKLNDPNVSYFVEPSVDFGKDDDVYFEKVIKELSGFKGSREDEKLAQEIISKAKKLKDAQ